MAFQQAGYFTAAQARSIGYSYQAQKYHVDRGNWVRVDRRLYRLAEWPSAADDIYARWWVWSEGRAVISYESAAAVHQLSDLDPGLVHLSLPEASTSSAGVVLHPDRLERSDIEDRGSFRVTTPTRTLLDLATTGTSQEQLNTAVHDAIGTGLVAAGMLRRRMDDFGSDAALRLERALATAPVPT